jgi:hypothetical protein
MANRNFMFKSSKLSAAATFLAVMVTILSVGKDEARAGECKTIRGHFTSQVLLPSPPCSSLFGICVAGKAIGGLQGDFVATVTGLNFATNVAGIVFVTTDVVLQTADGDLFIKETGAVNLDPASDGDVATIGTISGGTEKWAEATGHIRIAGTLTVEANDVDYEGQVCLP